MNYPRRPNTPSLPQDRTPRVTPFAPGRQPDIQQFDGAPTLPPPAAVDPFVVSAYPARPINSQGFNQPFAGRALFGEDRVSSLAGNLFFGSNGGDANVFIVPEARRYVLRELSFAFYSHADEWNDPANFSLAPLPPAQGDFSILINGVPISNYARRMLVGPQGNLIRVPLWQIVEQGVAVGLSFFFPGTLPEGEILQGQVWGWIAGDDLQSSADNLSYEAANTRAVPVEG